MDVEEKSNGFSPKVPAVGKFFRGTPVDAGKAQNRLHALHSNSRAGRCRVSRRRSILS
jgi:hypothetical protein